MKIKSIIFLFSIALTIFSCAKKNDNNIRTIVQDYCETYQERSDFEKFLSFYDENIILEDIMLGEKKMGKKALTSFFNWDDPNFKKKEAKSCIISNQIIEGNQVVIKGYFTPFAWGEQVFNAMHFTSFLTFNKTRKIVKQVDWINYPSNLLDYGNRKDSNEWIQQTNE